MPTKAQLEEVAKAFLSCKASIIQAKEILWKAREGVYDAYAKTGQSCMAGEMWDIADIASLLTTLSHRVGRCVYELEEAAEKEVESGP